MEKDLKEKEYRNYINEHISNIHTAYLKYARILCEKLNISMFKLSHNIDIHDKSKYSEEEFDAYRQYFFPCSDEKKDKELFDKAWEHHYKFNRHHPEYWINEDGSIKDMDNIFIAEMLLDWAAMGIKFGDTAYSYYMKERDNKPLSDNTKQIIDSVIEIFK